MTRHRTAFFFLILIAVLAAPAVAQSPLIIQKSIARAVLRSPAFVYTWSNIIRMRDNCGTLDSIRIGQAAGATDGIDPSLGEVEIPPLPPPDPTTYDLRLILPGSPGPDALVDIRNDALNTISWRTTFQGCSYPLVFSWDSSAWPNGDFTLTDEANGTIVNVDMRTNGRYSLTNTGIVSLRINFVLNVHASPRFILQGPFVAANDSMPNLLRKSGVLATQFPGAAIPGLAVDSISVEIRNASTAGSSTVLLSASGWLLTDGTVRGFADTTKSYLTFPTSPGSFYIVIHPRNHLAVMSANQVSLNSTTPTYDFTTGQNKAFGSNALVQVGTRFCLMAGDANGSGDVTILDRALWRTQNSQSGYLGADMNLSGDVTILDRTLWRANNSLSSQVP